MIEIMWKKHVSELEKFRNQVIVENKYLKRQVRELKKELEKIHIFQNKARITHNR